MDYSSLEYKAPSYELLDRKGITPEKEAKHKALRRFSYSRSAKCFVSDAEKKNRITMLFAGDLLCQESMHEKFMLKDGGFDFSACFAFVKPLLKSADFAAGNLETSITHTAPCRGEILTHEGPYFCNAPAEYLEALSDCGFDMLTTANNHTLDAGARGIIETLENIDKCGIIRTGTFREASDPRYAIVNICGFKVGFAAFAYSFNTMEKNLTPYGKKLLLNTYSKATAREIFEKMKKDGAEYMICFPHWGKEYTQEISAKQLLMARDLTKIGYHAVLGSHSHQIQCCSRVNEKDVCYSLGNLISHMNKPAAILKNAQYTVLARIDLIRNGRNITSEISYIPCRILINYKGIPYTVLPVCDQLGLSEEAEPLLAGSTASVKEQLQSDSVCTDFAISADAQNAYSVFKENLPRLTDSLLKIPRKKTPAKPNIYNTDGEEAILTEYHINYTVFRMPQKAKGKPITQFNNIIPGNKDVRVLYLCKHIRSIGDYALKDFTTLESVRIFEELESVGKGAFSGCSTMTGIIMPDGAKTIGPCAFEGCVNLLSIKLPESIEEIGEDAFKGCDKLTVYCEENSYAHRYAAEHGIKVSFMPLSAEKSGSREENKMNTSNNPAVKMGPCNGPKDKHPAPIIAACFYLGTPLPENAVCGNQPSCYLPKKSFDGTLETIVKLLGDKMPDIDRDELTKKFKQFRKKYRTQENLETTKTDLSVYFADWLLFARPKGFGYNCYFDYELYNKEPDVRDTFINLGFRKRLEAACNEKAHKHYFGNKVHFNQKYAEHIHRDWIDAMTCSFEEFKEFIAKHDKFFGKPQVGTGGSGARVISADSGTPESLFRLCKEESLILEELVIQDDTLAKVNASTLNTIRLNTILPADGIPRITMGIARFGRAGNVADNFHSGGYCGVLNVETGEIISEVINNAHLRRSDHPDSKVSLVGFRYPGWDKIRQAVYDAAIKTPEMRHVGWDVCYTKDGNVEFIEGNCAPGSDALQSPDQVGRRYLYTEHLISVEKMKGIAPKEDKPLIIDITGMEGPAVSDPKTSAKPTKNNKNPFAKKLNSLKRKLKKLAKKVLKKYLKK